MSPTEPSERSLQASTAVFIVAFVCFDKNEVLKADWNQGMAIRARNCTPQQLKG